MPNCEGKWISIRDYEDYHDKLIEEYKKHKAAGVNNYIFKKGPAHDGGYGNNPNYMTDLCIAIIALARDICEHGKNYEFVPNYKEGRT